MWLQVLSQPDIRILMQSNYWNVRMFGLFTALAALILRQPWKDKVMQRTIQFSTNSHVSAAKVAVRSILGQGTHDLVSAIRITEVKDLTLTLHAKFQHIFSYFTRDKGIPSLCSKQLCYDCRLDEGDWVEGINGARPGFWNIGSTYQCGPATW